MDRLRTRYLKPVEVPVIATPKADLPLVQHTLSQAAALPAVTAQTLSAQACFEKALGCYLKRDLKGAIAYYQEALSINPQFAEAYCGLGLAERDQGAALGAVEHFRKALSLQPTHPMADEMLTYISRQRH